VVDPLPELKTALDTVKSAGSSTAFAYSLSGADQRGVTTRLTSKPWAYVLAVPLTDYTRAADDATANAVLTIAIGLVLSLLMAIVLTRSLVGPLRRLLHRATQVSTGDVDLREAYFDTQTGDDVIREVASAFDRMLTALRFYALADEDAARAARGK
jgi:methyl-accepting chemotaxis protein